MTSQEPLKILAHTAAVPRVQRAVSRRNFLGLTAALGGAAALTACGKQQGKAASVASQAKGGDLEDSLSIYSWGDYDDPELFDTFTEKFGPNIAVDAYASNEELISKLISSKGTAGYDIIVPTGPYIPQMIENKLLQKLNKDLLPNLEHMDPQFLNMDWDPQGEFTICKSWGTTGFVYDTTKIKRELKDWKDFLDCAMNEASGSTSLLDETASALGIYFWANGIDWNTTDEKDLKKCEDFMVGKLAKHISIFDSYPGGSAIPQGTSALIQVWNGDARLGILEDRKGDRWKWVLGAPDTELWMDCWAISSTARHPEAAHAFLNFILDPDNQMANVDYIGYNSGAKGLEQRAKKEKFEMFDLVFFTPEQVKTMHEQRLSKVTERLVEIHSKMKAAASA